jgi:hypothetical protein
LNIIFLFKLNFKWEDVFKKNCPCFWNHHNFQATNLFWVCNSIFLYIVLLDRYVSNNQMIFFVWFLKFYFKHPRPLKSSSFKMKIHVESSKNASVQLSNIFTLFGWTLHSPWPTSCIQLTFDSSPY